jgi:hypothetical protein
VLLVRGSTLYEPTIFVKVAKATKHVRDARATKMLLKPFQYLWALPNTILGLLFLVPAILTGGGIELIQGCIEIRGGIVAFLLRRCTLLPNGASAMTLGHVILGRDALALDMARDHEHVHVRQYERWGPFFIPAYLIVSIVLWFQRRNPYLDNPFEREAYGRNP